MPTQPTFLREDTGDTFAICIGQPKEGDESCGMSIQIGRTHMASRITKRRAVELAMMLTELAGGFEPGMGGMEPGETGERVP